MLGCCPSLHLPISSALGHEGHIITFEKKSSTLMRIKMESISRDCGLECQETPFQQTLDDLLLRLAQKGSPALWPLISLRNGADVPKFLRCGACWKMGEVLEQFGRW